MKFQKALIVLAVTGVSSVALLAAPPKTETKTTKPQTGDPASRSADHRTSWKNADHLLASCVAIENQEEVAIAKFAQKKLKNNEAQDFAKMLIDDHSAFLKKLEAYAPEATREGFLADDKTARETAATKAPTQRTAAKPNLDEQHNGLPIDMMQLHRELAQQCLRNSEEMLNEKNGKHFDECFIGMQIAKHAAMKTKLEVFQRHASGELKDLLAQGEKTTASHLKQAIKIMEQLADASDKTADAK